MNKPIPRIFKYMTAMPYTAQPNHTLDSAMRLMRAQQIRHLPILDGGRLVGMLSERDINTIESYRGVDPSKYLVEDAMEQQVYAVPPSAPLDEVVAEMASKKYGSAVVMRNLDVIGIFTAVDALGALSSLLQSRLANA